MKSNNGKRITVCGECSNCQPYNPEGDLGCIPIKEKYGVEPVEANQAPSTNCPLPDWKIVEGRICPYCNQPTAYVDSREIYGKSYGMIYLCRPCKAWVGVHKGTDNALGRLANAELREAKKEAHRFFDIIWKSKQMTRTGAYRYMARCLDMPIEGMHIGMLDVEQCKRIVYYSKELLNDLRRLDLDMGAIPKTQYMEV